MGGDVLSSVIGSSAGDDCWSVGPISETTSLGSDGTCGFGLDGLDPLLAVPAYNGGPTATMLPDPHSPLLGAGKCFAYEDQRGVTRPSIECDIGSVEL